MMVSVAEEFRTILSENGAVASENSPTIHNNLMTMLSEPENIQESIASFMTFIENMRAEEEAENDDDNSQQAA